LFEKTFCIKKFKFLSRGKVQKKQDFWEGIIQIALELRD